MIGNAVPPRLAKVLAEALLSHVESRLARKDRAHE
jgi:site-specific DNA-cytosine methylase